MKHQINPSLKERVSTRHALIANTARLVEKRTAPASFKNLGKRLFAFVQVDIDKEVDI